MLFMGRCRTQIDQHPIVKIANDILRFQISVDYASILQVSDSVKYVSRDLKDFNN